MADIKVCSSRSLCIERNTLESPCLEDVGPVYTGRGCIQFWHCMNKNSSLRKQPTFREVAIWALTKRRLSNERRKFHTDDVHYPDLGSASDMVERKFPRGTTNQKHYQDLGSARHQCGISALVTQTSFCEGSSGDLAKRRLFSQATRNHVEKFIGRVREWSILNAVCKSKLWL